MTAAGKTNWKPIFITLLCTALIALSCCWGGLSLVRGGLQVPLLIIGALSAFVFLVQLLVAFISLVLDAIRK